MFSKKESHLPGVHFTFHVSFQGCTPKNAIPPKNKASDFLDDTPPRGLYSFGWDESNNLPFEMSTVDDVGWGPLPTHTHVFCILSFVATYLETSSSKLYGCFRK